MQRTPSVAVLLVFQQWLNMSASLTHVAIHMFCYLRWIYIYIWHHHVLKKKAVSNCTPVKTTGDGGMVQGWSFVPVHPCSSSNKCGIILQQTELYSNLDNGEGNNNPPNDGALITKTLESSDNTRLIGNMKGSMGGVWGIFLSEGP